MRGPEEPGVRKGPGGPLECLAWPDTPVLDWLGPGNTNKRLGGWLGG